MELKEDDKYFFMKRDDFDSLEEYHFYLWTIEALQHDLIKNVKYHPWKATLGHSVSLKVPKPTKRKPDGTRKIHLLQAIQYEPDWILEIYPDRNFLLKKNIVPLRSLPQNPNYWEPHHGGAIVMVDIKGNYTAARMQPQKFPVIQKWMFQKFGIYINKIIPKKFFMKFWCPELATYTPKTGKKSKRYTDCQLIEAWLKENKNGTYD
jgi:hypothetical protein